MGGCADFLSRRSIFVGALVGAQIFFVGVQSLKALLWVRAQMFLVGAQSL